MRALPVADRSSTTPSTAGRGTRAGNTDPHMAPHGVYPSSGDDRWVAVACRDDADWRALAGLLGRDDLADLSTAERLARHDELDELVAAWTARAVARRGDGGGDRRRRAGARGAELGRVLGRPAARPPRALGHAPAPRPRHDRRRELPGHAQRHPARGRRRPRRSSARTPSTSCSASSATTTPASATCTPPAPWTRSFAGAAAPSRRVRPVVGVRSPAACQVRSRHHRRVELRASSALSTRTGETHDPHAPSDPHRRSRRRRRPRRRRHDAQPRRRARRRRRRLRPLAIAGPTVRRQAVPAVAGRSERHPRRAPGLRLHHRQPRRSDRPVVRPGQDTRPPRRHRRRRRRSPLLHPDPEPRAGTQPVPVAVRRAARGRGRCTTPARSTPAAARC